MRIKNLEKLLPIIKKKLPEYLKEKGLKINYPSCQCPRGFLNLGHKNRDTGKLSAWFVKNTDNSKIFCAKEGINLDIIDCYSLFENKPKHGVGFFILITELCKKYNIQYEIEDQYSPAEIEKQNKRELLALLHTLSLKKDNIKHGLEYYKKRNLNKEKIIFYKIGCIKVSSVTEDINKKFKTLFNYGLLSVLESSALVIPVFNEYNQYDGLQLRQIEPGAKNKYLNLFIGKGRKLYNTNNLHNEEEVYLVEGVFDAISLFPNTNVLATLTSSIGNGSIEYLSKKGIKKIYLALDPDLNEKSITENGIIKSIMNLKNVDSEIFVVDIPKKTEKEFHDPDSFIQDKGVDEFIKLKKISAINFLISKVKEKYINRKQLFEFVIGCPNIITKEKYISKISDIFQIGKRNLIKKLEEIEQKESPIDIVRFVEEKDFVNRTLEEYAQKALNNQFKGVLSGYKLFDSYLGGFENTVYLFAGYPQMGKTSILINFLVNLIQNPKNFVAFYSIDDGLHRGIIPRLLSMITGISSREMKTPTTKENRNELIKGLKVLSKLKSNFTFKDGSHIRTVWGDLEEFIKIHYKIAEDKNKNFIIMIDNLHALVCSSKYNSTEDAKRIASYLKRLPQVYNCPVITTAEVPKSAESKPTGKDIKESIDFWYTARLVAGIFSAPRDTTAKKNRSDHLWFNHNEKMYPIVEFFISKNQTGDTWHGSLFYKLYLHNNTLKECSEEEMVLLRDRQYID